MEETHHNALDLLAKFNPLTCLLCFECLRAEIVPIPVFKNAFSASCSHRLKNNIINMSQVAFEEMENHLFHRGMPL